MRQKIAEAVPAAGLGGKQHPALARQAFDLIALAFEIALCAGGQCLGRLRGGRFVLVLECVQRLFADVLTKAFISRAKFGALRQMHTLTEATRKVRMSRNQAA